MEFPSVNPEDLLNDVVSEGDDGSCQLGWELENEMFDLLAMNEAVPEDVNPNSFMMVEQFEQVLPDEPFDWSILKDLNQEAEVQREEEAEVQHEPEAEASEEDNLEVQVELQWEFNVELELREESPNAIETEPVEVEESQFEQELAQLDGECVDVPLEPSAISPMDWNLVWPRSSNASIMALRVCFARHMNDQYTIYEAYDDMGYHYWGVPLYVPQSELQLRQQLTEDYYHLFPFAELPSLVKEVIIAESRGDITNLLHNCGGCMCQNQGAVMCAARLERLDIVLNSSIGNHEETHSGINVFGEPTRVTIAINGNEILLENSLLIELVKQPFRDFYIIISANIIYLINGQILLESTSLSNYLVPIRNINLVVYSPRQFGD